MVILYTSLVCHVVGAEKIGKNASFQAYVMKCVILIVLIPTKEVEHGNIHVLGKFNLVRGKENLDDFVT